MDRLLDHEMQGGFILPDAGAIQQDVSIQSDQPNPDIRPLSQAQERRLVAHLEQRFIEINRGFKKRSDPSSTAPHLHAYLLASQPLLALILMIPPLDPSASLRVAYLLRLTGDILDAIPSYPLLGPPPTIDPSLLNPPPPVETTLIKVVDIITQLDKGWSAVLQSQAWDPVAHQGQGSFIATRGPSQTDKTRLVSILVQGRDAIGTWLASGQIPLGVDLQDEFASVFWRSLAQLERDQ